MKQLFKTKKIYSKGKLFLWRLNIYLKNGSIKLHIMFNDDTGTPHNHPWDFKTFLIIPYKEKVFNVTNTTISDYNIKTVQELKHSSFTYLKRCKEHLHLTNLYRIFRTKIPAVTIGWYGNKQQLCNLCQDVGYCKQSK